MDTITHYVNKYGREAAVAAGAALLVCAVAVFMIFAIKYHNANDHVTGGFGPHSVYHIKKVNRADATCFVLMGSRNQAISMSCTLK